MEFGGRGIFWRNFSSRAGLDDVSNAKAMQNRQTSQHDHPVKQDPVWELIGRSSARPPGPRFVDDVVRQAKLEGVPAGWLAGLRERWFSPVPALALSGMAVAAILAGIFVWTQPVHDGAHDDVAAIVLDPSAKEDRLDHLQEVLETEMLFVAVEHLDEFSDAELVVLIGF